MKGRDIPHARKRASELRKRETPAEKVVWACIRKRQLGPRFHRQVPLTVENGTMGKRYIIADFYCTEHRIAIEVDGGSHIGKEKQDAERDEMLRSNGIKVLRFWNKEVYESENWLLRLQALITTPENDDNS
jgi:very-short-patch-repair endonuclease